MPLNVFSVVCYQLLDNNDQIESNNLEIMSQLDCLGQKSMIKLCVSKHMIVHILEQMKFMLNLIVYRMN
ncbi:unnamed protein product [Adineta ricciae]|uniref:Uncharacterized protein n=1 Tax=Adineta ricciae TaxID=249248 RepID=A0A815FUP1_ADIRI|nr:unnamed protein product [Adineta ricciae]